MPTPNERLISAHPVDVGVREDILAQLTTIEARWDVRVLYACESGSRGWGFASPDSDYDVRFLYVHRLPWYVSVHPHRDVIELPIHADLDIGGWELRKALGLLHKSSPVLLEWLDSPIVYREEASIAQLRALLPGTVHAAAAWHHYAVMAKKNAHLHLQGEQVRYKKYFYVLRPLLAARWLRQHQGGIAPMRFAALAQATLDPAQDAALLTELNALLTLKMRGDEAATGPRWAAVDAFIHAELQANTHPPTFTAPTRSTAVLDAFLYQTAYTFTHP
jgi:predicted nucleotidyltransferase